MVSGLLKVEGFEVGHLVEFGFIECVRSVRAIVLGNDHFAGFHHLVDTLSSVPVGGVRMAILNGEERVFFDRFTAPFLFAEKAVNLPLFGERQGMQVGSK